MIIILIISCASKRTTSSFVSEEKNRQEVTVDSGQTVHVMKEIKREPVKADTATAKIAISSIENLPATAKFTAQSGRASVELHKTDDDSIVITAICDSLQNLVYYYEKEFSNYELRIKNYENELTVTKNEKTKKSYNPYLAYLLGLSSGGLIVLVFVNKKSILDNVLNFIKKLFK